MSEQPRVRENTIAMVIGPKGSGKSRLLDHYFTSRAPRVIHLDFVGEIGERYPGAIETVGLEATLAQLRAFAANSEMKWHLVAVFPEHRQHEMAALFRALAPEYNGKTTPPGIARAFGGIALECSECDIMLPNNASEETRAARNLLKRGRHERLDLFLATQRPQECSRLCTSQADFIVAFQTHEPRELDYLSRGAGEDFARRVRALPQYSSLWFARASRAIVERDKNGTIVQAARTTG